MSVIIYTAQRNLLLGVTVGDTIELPIEFRTATESYTAVRRVTRSASGRTQTVIDRVDRSIQLETTYNRSTDLPALRQFIGSVFSGVFTVDVSDAAVSAATLTGEAFNAELDSSSVTFKRLGSTDAYRISFKVREV